MGLPRGLEGEGVSRVVLKPEGVRVDGQELERLEYLSACSCRRWTVLVRGVGSRVVQAGRAGLQDKGVLGILPSYPSLYFIIARCSPRHERQGRSYRSESHC